MPGIAIPDPDVLGRMQFLVIANGLEQLLGVDGVLHGVQGLLDGTAGAAVLAPAPIVLCFLDMARIRQHDRTQIDRCLRGINRVAVALGIKLGQPAAVVDVGMGQEQEVNLVDPERERLVVETLFMRLALVQATVNQEGGLFSFNQIAGAGYSLGCTQKCHFHKDPLSISPGARHF